MEMFKNCSSLLEVSALKYWNVSNVKNFQGMFKDCESLSDINGLQNWDVSNGNNFSFMFFNCFELPDLKPLRNWNVSNGKIFYRMFVLPLSKLKYLEKWKIPDNADFENPLFEDDSLEDISL